MALLKQQGRERERGTRRPGMMDLSHTAKSTLVSTFVASRGCYPCDVKKKANLPRWFEAWREKGRVGDWSARPKRTMRRPSYRRRPLILLLPLFLQLAHAMRSAPFHSGHCTAPARMAASLPSVDPALKLVLRAAGDRGKADLSSLRALAGLIGADDGLRALERQLGISEDATDAEIQVCALLALPDQDPDPSPAPPGRRDLHSPDADPTRNPSPNPTTCPCLYPYPSPNSVCC